MPIGVSVTFSSCWKRIDIVAAGVQGLTKQYFSVMHASLLRQWFDLKVELLETFKMASSKMLV